jgi:triacylglycerol lipase
MQPLLVFIVAWSVTAAAGSFTCQFKAADSSDVSVILVHGLRSSSRSFERLQAALLAENFNVAMVDYPSTCCPIEMLADSALIPAVNRCRDASSRTIHFVGHSMGAILVRYFLQEHEVPELGRVVLLSPPNHGTELIDKLSWFAPFRKFNGPGGMQLGAKADGFVNRLEKPRYEFLIIQSRRSINPLASLLIPGKDDGRVSFNSAELEGAAALIWVNSHHHAVMKKDETIRNIVRFLKPGADLQNSCMPKN